MGYPSVKSVPDNHIMDCKNGSSFLFMNLLYINRVESGRPVMAVKNFRFPVNNIFKIEGGTAQQTVSQPLSGRLKRDVGP